MKRYIPKGFITMLICAGCCCQVAAQSSASLLKRADAAYKRIELRKALQYYKLAVEGKRKRTEGPAAQETVQRIAWLEQQLHHYQEAVAWFEQISYNQAAPSWLLAYSQALANVEQYTRADSCIEAYRQRTGNRQIKMDFSRVQQLLSDSAAWKVEYVSLNSSMDEFSPYMYGRRLLFVTNQYISTALKRVDMRNERSFLQLRMVLDTGKLRYTDIRELDMEAGDGHQVHYVVNDDDGPSTANDSRRAGLQQFRYQDWKGIQRPGLSHGVPVFDTHVESKYHEGPVCFSSKFDTIYFTRGSNRRNKRGPVVKGIGRVRLYSAVYSNGLFKQERQLPFNSDQYSTGHPALSRDGAVLFFVSDMPGGQGGTDIYYVLKQADGSWGTPVNAGPTVNTAGNEMFPYIADDNRLYFSSDGHPGLGGLDIYHIQWRNGGFTGLPKNMGYPVNTAGDDFGIWYGQDAGGSYGYFSSDRYGDDDIFRFRRCAPPSSGGYPGQ